MLFRGIGISIHLEELVKKYFSAWNRRDIGDLLAVLHNGAAYYDAFWRESCVGRDLRRYFTDCLADDPLWYELIGDLIVADDGVVCRYAAHERNGSAVGRLLFEGAEVLTLRDGLILTISDHYCDSRPESLQEVVTLAVRRHGEPTYAKAGLSAVKASRFKKQLSTLMATDKVYLNRSLTVSRLADQIGCSVDQLFRLINAEFGTDFDEYVNHHRVNHARDLLAMESNKPDHISRIATEVGFPSTYTFKNEFKKWFGVTPEDFVGDTDLQRGQRTGTPSL